MSKLGLLQMAGPTSASNVQPYDILVCTTHATQTLHVGPPTATGLSPLAIHTDRIRVNTAFRYVPPPFDHATLRSGTLAWTANQLVVYDGSNVWWGINLEDVDDDPPVQ